MLIAAWEGFDIMLLECRSRLLIVSDTPVHHGIELL